MEDKLRDFPKMTSLPVTHIITWMVGDPPSRFEYTSAFPDPIREDLPRRNLPSSTTQDSLPSDHC